MKALVLSRFSLGELYSKLKKAGIKKFVDYYRINPSWKDTEDVINVMKKQKCNTIVTVCNFYLALKVMSELALKQAFVVIPKRTFGAEILKADIYIIESEKVKLTVYES